MNSAVDAIPFTSRIRTLKAITFDVDGTLYRQTPLRRAMLFRLLSAHAVTPITGWKTFAALRAYRNAQEHARHGASGGPDAQLRLACEKSGFDADTMTAYVERWMEREPLPILPKCIQPGLPAFLEFCRDRGLRIAALSDYPPEAKLEALGVRQYFDVTLSAQSPEVGTFKPDPKGIRVALERLGVAATDALYVGDRPEVDAAAAKAAGVACVIVSRRGAGPTPQEHLTVETFAQLQHLLQSVVA